jgi:hypothetical protein
MRRRAFLGMAAATMLASATRVHADSGLVAGTQAVVNTDGVNLRGGPSADQPIVGTLSEGMQVDLLGASSDAAWWRVATDAGIGHVSGAFLSGTGVAVSSAAVDIDLDIPYARQLTSIWCDPADLEMWRGYRQGTATNGGTRALQSAIWDWETSHNAGFSVDQWDCSPYAVASAASHWMPDASFDHFTYDDAAAGSQVLASLLANDRLKEPSIALIWRGLHYVLVRGVRLGADGQPLGFYVADPDPGASFFLGSDRFIGIDRWLGELFTPVSYLTPHTGVPGDVWQNQMVTIQRAFAVGGPSLAGVHNATVINYA